jgi:hypothetical protein
METYTDRNGNCDTYTLIRTYAIADLPNGRSSHHSMPEDLDTAWELCKDLSKGCLVTLYRIGTHSNYGNPLTGTSTAWFERGAYLDSATRYTEPR